jgi:hypothetical protein
MNAVIDNPEIIAEYTTLNRLALTLIKMGTRRKWLTQIIAIIPSKSGGEEHKARVFRPGKNNVGFRCTCKAAEFNRKCHAVKAVERIAEANRLWGR